MPDLDILDVRLHGGPVGTLTRLGRERIVFGFDSGYLDDAERPTLSLSFRDAFGRVATDVAPTRVEAPPFFSNLLPEGSLREYLARSAGIDPKSEFALLGALGEDLPGALSIAPAGG
ncbi:MAG: type II toxin-antitoxin system HipA family toxin, partial [Gemmatimonadetes bacterium]|nr:type II toxin-antitoxin system HipA family toxin [Gemmatimonadota bacterium]